MLTIEDLRVTHRTRSGLVHAVDGVNLTLRRGETLGLVGESGCGKSTLARAVMRLTPPASGRILLDGTDVTRLKGRAAAPFTARVQMVFQDPAASLDPRYTVARAIAEPLLPTVRDAAERARRVAALMDDVGLARALADRFPHQLSGGQRQRVAIARAIAPRPDFVVLDEPVSALDVSLQAQVLNLLVDLQERHGLAYLFIGHDIGVVRHMADRVAVMYLGRVVEIGDWSDVVDEPAHPYTRALMAAAPAGHPDAGRAATRAVLAGELPSPFAPPPGCAFHTRCPLAVERCRREAPALRDAADGRRVACHLAPTQSAETNPAETNPTETNTFRPLRRLP
ncbi:ABC transporter ATP-binding protein [Azospirillum argentinense]|uniref:ABC transporter domain-containing protein n=1 Tax=Azospirillum argentinense TaxID=2970906 RepID=A0A5B0KPB1_9PROT|nr:ABC transporter ATP-binding protein [Azospirillum argentinense]KAA1054139.1 Dipeptide transport ATP-binding protein DppF [Azospirillum argentinense]